MIKLMIVEDNKIVSEGLSELLSEETGISVVAEAADGHSAIQQLQQDLLIDVMLVDWNMPNMSGIELTRLVKAQNPGIKVVILTMHSKDDYKTQALDAGAAAYILKDLEIEEIAGIIRKVAANAR
jgi:DNA-binding NarL/FixJ family response regulator